MKTFFDARRPLGRLSYFLISLCVAALSARLDAQAPQTTQITDIVYRSDGTPAQGTILISWTNFTTADNKAVAAGTLSVPIGAGGAVSVALVPNSGANPAGTYYKIVYQLASGENSQEYWSVPAVGPTTIGAIRSRIVPSGVAIQVASRQYVDDQLATKATDANIVHKTGNENVAGVKTFSASPTVPTPAISTDAANKAYVDANAGGGGGATTAFVVASTQIGATADVKIANGYTALPAAGGTLWVELPGAQSVAADPFAGMTKPAHIIFNSGTFTISSNLTVPRNVTIDLRQGAVWSVNAGQTVTILGTLLAPRTQVFAGAGSVAVTGNDTVPVEWYGAKNDALIVQNCGATAGSAVLSGCTPYTGAGFTAADAGKLILFHDYAYGAFPGIAAATIATVNSASSVTLSVPATRSASGSIAYYGTDALRPLQAALSANGTKRYLFTKRAPPSSASGSPAATADYLFSNALVINTSPACANGIWLDGNVPSGGWTASGTNLVFPSTTGGIKAGPDCFQFKISNLQLFGLGGWYAGTLSTYTLYSTDLTADGPHGLVLAGGEPQAENLWLKQFAGNGIYIDGNGGVFPSGNPSQPDLWKLSNIGTENNRGYGVFVSGTDANAGVGTMFNSRGNQLGGIRDASVLGNTFVAPASHQDANAALSRGVTTALTSTSVAANVLTGSTSAAHGFTNNQWVRIAGQADPSFNTDACRLTSVPTTTTFTCAFTHANGSTTGGTAQTSASGDVFAFYAAAATPTPFVSGSYIGKGGSSTNTWVKPYCELLSEAPPSFGDADLVLNGNCLGPTSTGGATNYGGLSVGGGQVTVFNNGGFRVWRPNGGNMNMTLLSGQAVDPAGPGYNSFSAVNLNLAKYDQSVMYQMNATPGAPNSFYLTDIASGGGLFSSGGSWSLRAGGINDLNIQASSGGDTNFYCGGGTLCGQFLTSGGIFKATLPDFTAAAASRPIKAGTAASAPATCVASKDLYIKTDATAGQQLFLCNATGNGWVLLGDGTGASGVSSFNSRTGAVVPATNDYDWTQIANKPATFPPSAHTHLLVDITNAGTSAGKNVPASGDATTTQVVLGNDSRLTNARTPTAHTHLLIDVTNAGTAAAKNVPASGDAATTEVVQGSDSRLTNARTPTAHTHVLADVTNAGTAAAKNVPASGDAATTEVVQGSDSRLTNARTPTAHTHPESDVTNLTTDLAGKVATSRAVNTTSPLTGGGDLSADRTFACATCEVSGNKNAVSGYAGLDSGARIAKAQAPAATVYTDTSANFTAQQYLESNRFFVTTDFTTAANTNLQTITGLSWALPANTVLKVPFQCHLAYAQGTAAAAVSLAIQSATFPPTNIFSTGIIHTSATAHTTGNLPVLNTTTATVVVTATPSAITTVWNADVFGFIEGPSNASANTINIMVKTATAADAVTIKRGSYCTIY